MRSAPFIFLAFPLLVLTACSVGPNYHRPRASVPPQWTAARRQALGLAQSRR